MLGKFQGKTNFTAALLDIFDIILWKEFFRRYHTMIDPYLQRLMVMEWEGSCMVPLINVAMKEKHAYLSAIHIMKGLKKGEPTFLATIASSGEDNGTMESLPPIIETFHKENKDVMPEELPQTLPSRCEVYHKIEVEIGAKHPHMHFTTWIHQIKGSKEAAEEAPRDRSYTSIQGTLWHASAITEEKRWVIALMHRLSGAQ